MWLDEGLTQVEYDKFWTPFNVAFDFQPDFYERQLPAIREPRGSVTLDLAGVFAREGGFAADEALIDAAARECFALLFAEQEMVFLDWQHQSYTYRPDVEAPARVKELIPVFPNGDYLVHALADMSSGTFGHPWQQSLCIWGASLVDTLGQQLPTSLPILRRDGVAVPH